MGVCSVLPLAADPALTAVQEAQLWVKYTKLKEEMDTMRKALLATSFAPQIKAENPKKKKAAVAKKPAKGGVAKPRQTAQEKAVAKAVAAALKNTK